MIITTEVFSHFSKPPNADRRYIGTTLNDYVNDYTPASRAVPTHRSHFEVQYNGLGLGIRDREFDITQCCRSPSLPSVHITGNPNYYTIIALVGHILLSWDQEPIMGRLWPTFILRWPFLF